MLFPLVGLIFFCIVLTPFAVAYVAIAPQARSFGSFARFYLGAFLWPFLVTAVFEVFELQNIWLNGKLGLVAFLAPFGGALFDWVWRQFLQGQASPKKFIPALLTSVLMVAGAFFHFLYLESTDINPTYSEQSLIGTWRGREGDLVLRSSHDWSRTGDWGLTINASGYRVIRSFGQLCLAQYEDPDVVTIVYRKLPDR